MKPLPTNQADDQKKLIVISDQLLLFTRFPEPGKVKTRLIPALGADGAASLHRALTEHILQIIKDFINLAKIDFCICSDGAEIHEMHEMFGSDHLCSFQAEGDLGQRMSAAFAASLKQGRRRVVLIGSDCPGISAQILKSAFIYLDRYDLVLGPANDGGYYLIGLSALYPEIFQNLPWGTADVLAITLARAAGLGLKTILLEPLTDIDRPEDLPVWEKIRSGHD